MERGAMSPVLRLTLCEIARAGVLDGRGGGVACGQTRSSVVVVVVEGEREVDDDELTASRLKGSIKVWTVEGMSSLCLSLANA